MRTFYLRTLSTLEDDGLLLNFCSSQLDVGCSCDWRIRCGLLLLLEKWSWYVSSRNRWQQNVIEALIWWMLLLWKQIALPKKVVGNTTDIQNSKKWPKTCRSNQIVVDIQKTKRGSKKSHMNLHTFGSKCATEQHPERKATYILKEQKSDGSVRQSPLVFETGALTAAVIYCSFGTDQGKYSSRVTWNLLLKKTYRSNPA